MSSAPQPEPDPEPDSEPMVTDKRNSLWRAWVDATRQAEANEVAFTEITPPISERELREYTETLVGLIAAKTQKVAF